ncbi:MAG: glutamate-1-semialdehyde 2,1-aminomutase [Phycisphaerales bacterium]|nr:MAG: glutamate-1-semialdehyde 2,1-aminomutase [Phycisphaerales bacterium]
MDERTSQRATDRSQAAHKTALRLIPGGSYSPLFGTIDTDEAPPCMLKGRGAVLTDVDGNEYLDYSCACGSLILGHADERTVVAIDKAAAKGFSLGAPTESEARLAELLVSRSPGMDMVGLVNSVAEAVTTAIRLARALRQRNRIVRFEGCCHGPLGELLAGTNVDVSAAKAGRDARVTEGAATDTLILPYNDPEAAESMFATHGDTIAAVVIEPVACHMGLVPPVEEALPQLRALCDRYGSLLIFDEKTTGFRVSAGGAIARYDVRPDLVCYGAVVGGGLSLAALAGSKEIMSGMLSHEGFLEPGALNGNPLAVAAGIATLQATSEGGFYEELEAKSARLEEGLRAALADTGVPAYLSRVASILGLLFVDHDVSSWSDARLADVGRFCAFRNALLDRGVYWAPAPWECAFVSAAHTDEQIDQTIEAAHESLRVCFNSGE